MNIQPDPLSSSVPQRINPEEQQHFTQEMVSQTPNEISLSDIQKGTDIAISSSQNTIVGLKEAVKTALNQLHRAALAVKALSEKSGLLGLFRVVTPSFEKASASLIKLKTKISGLSDRVYPSVEGTEDPGVELLSYSSTKQPNTSDNPFNSSRIRKEFKGEEEWKGSEGEDLGTEKIHICQTRDDAQKINAAQERKTIKTIKKILNDPETDPQLKLRIRNFFVLSSPKVEDELREILQTVTDPLLRKALIQLGVCKKAKLSVNREQGEFHATATREALQAAILEPKKPISASDLAICESPNTQVHSHTQGSGTISFVQTGALSDHRNTFLSLAMLKAFTTEEEKRTKEQKELVTRFEAKKNELEKLQKEVDEGKSTLSLIQQKILKHMLLDFKDPQRALEERTEILQRQALILFQTHVKQSIADGWRPPAPLTMAHQSLLNPGTSTWDRKTGITHDEASLIEDMAEILGNKEYTLTFTGDAATIGGTSITLPESLLPEGILEKSTKVHTHFANTQVAGSPAKSPDLAHLNEELLAAVKKDLSAKKETEKKALLQIDPTNDYEKYKAAFLALKKTERGLASLERAKKALTDKHVSTEVATDLIEAQKIAGWSVSFGCYSNKDRGGVVGKRALIQMRQNERQDMIAFLKAEEERTRENHQVEIAKLQKEIKELNPFRYTVFHPRSLQMRVINHSVTKGQRFVKFNPASDLRIFRPKNLKALLFYSKLIPAEESARSESN